ncbi:XdhC/CoxI family protein [Actinacidiphila sp. DG2A-62]|uniref:XdhC family protein n=1 Tax=Actinacidiphila sp. DG2A-62 TaxID=3108821 RepID=UPI002DB60E11|nr:XdhC/CoxI family protein [Actinacidiphila sp. DG2A-62]MEC3993773.1 XdhC/CoxI family protein [Actinacidiphila sp. DG2A-62]
MRDLATDLIGWQEEGAAYAVATVVSAHGSAPRMPGAAMAVHADGRVVGSVSGGCVEAAVYDLAQEVLATGTPRLARFGWTEDDAFAVGLTCGGTIEVFVQAVSATEPVAWALRASAAGRPVTLARVLSGPLAGAAVAVSDDAVRGGTGDPGLDATMTADGRAMLAGGGTDTREYGPHGACEGDEVRVLYEPWTAPPRLLVFGAQDYAAAVTRVGRFLGYRVTLCDARATFATPSRFPDAHEVVVAWPHRYLATTPTDRRTAVCVLTHDEKFDIPLLADALTRDLAYVGALGSRATHAARLERLRQAGVTARQRARLRAPIGLDLGARTPEETAVAIAAELVACRRGGTGRPLSTLEGPIHARPDGRQDPSGLLSPAAG